MIDGFQGLNREARRAYLLGLAAFVVLGVVAALLGSDVWVICAGIVVFLLGLIAFNERLIRKVDRQRKELGL